jgi:transposase
MSTSPYSQDLREKVIKYIESGGSQISASKIFSLGYNTINRWYVRYKQEGHVRPRIRPGAKPSVSREEFIRYVEANPNMDSDEIGKYFSMGATGAQYWLKKFGFSYKKKPIPIWKLTKREEGNF